MKKSPLHGKTHSRRSREHSTGVLFICLGVLEMKKQHYIFNNSSILQTLGKDHLLFLKKILILLSRLSVCSLYNSESDPKTPHFLYNSYHQIVSYNHLQQ